MRQFAFQTGKQTFEKVRFPSVRHAGTNKIKHPCGDIFPFCTRASNTANQGVFFLKKIRFFVLRCVASPMSENIAPTISHKSVACPIICCMNCTDCLPQEIGAYLKNVQELRELRLRNGKAIKVNVGGRWFWLGKNSLLTSPQRALRFENICDDFVKKACNQSVYAYEKMLAQGFFTLSDGARVGVCGIQGANGVFQKYTSLCVRTARYFACAEPNFLGSVVVAGPPGSGKTTYLRDLACKLSSVNNVVVVDERGEISACVGFDSHSDCDVFKYSPKRYAFEVAVRTMSPDWIVCDELSQSDLPLLTQVVESGVNLAASVHSQNLDGLKKRLGEAINCFSYAVILQKDTFAQQIVNLKGDGAIRAN